MSLLPLRPLPVNDAPANAFVIRALIRSTSASIYVRRQEDKKTWSCKVHSFQEILAPSQQARELDLIAVVTCLYHGIGFASSAADAFAGGPLELTRREVAFTQPETWTDDSYRLTTRISIRGSVAAAAAAPAVASVLHADNSAQAVHGSGGAVAIPVAEIQDEDIVFGFHFSPSSASIDLVPRYLPDAKNQAESLQLVGAAFPNSFLNWLFGSNKNFVRPIKDGVVVRAASELEVTLDVVHPKGPALFVVSVGATMVKPTNSWTYECHSKYVLQCLQLFDFPSPCWCAPRNSFYSSEKRSCRSDKEQDGLTTLLKMLKQFLRDGDGRAPFGRRL